MSLARRALFVATIGAGLLLVVAVFLRATGSGTGGSGLVGRAAPLFDSKDLAGHPVVLGDYKGRRVVLNFWASWCQPCRTEFPVLQQLESRHPDVAVLGVVFQDADDPARAFLKAEGATWPGVRDPKSQIAGAYDVHAKPGIPVSILIDASGRVRAYQYGPLVDAAAADAFIAAAH